MGKKIDETYKVWLELELERSNGESYDDLDLPFAATGIFSTEEEAFDFAQTLNEIGGYLENRDIGSEDAIKAIDGYGTLHKALMAIVARIQGEWDNPALVEFGFLSESRTTDILNMAEKALRPPKGEETHG